MSKAAVNSSPMKQDVNPYKKDNRGPHVNSSNDKRSSDSFSKPSSNSGNRDRDRSSRQDRSRDDFDRRNTGADASHADDDKQTDKAAGDSTSTGEKKFTGRCRLFVGNLTQDITETDFRKMFETYGEISEVYVNQSRGFGFIRLDYRQNAEAAKAALDGTQRKGRILRVRFATHGAALKVKNLHPFVSNELLEQSFSQFGELERCIVIVDDRGKSTGEGIVEFVRKPGANSALRRINEGVFLMGMDPKPVAVEPLEQKDEEDGMPEKFLTKTEQYKKEREKEPRFAPPGTFEYEFGMRWKQLEELEKQRIEQVKKDTEDARLKLEDEMQNALYEYQAEQIRQDLLRQQEELRRLEELRNSDRMRRQQEMEMRRQKDDHERATQEERRRADMMMSMRQQEIARGRSGPLDPPGMRSREEMMMADRFGDRMPDRMSDRMQDRMVDRMGQGPGGFNMWPDEKQRSEAMRNEAMRNEANLRNESSLRNEPGRGREMRGPGASPLQQPSGPPSGMNNMERGGPPSSTASTSAAGSSQNTKSSPKPLMPPGVGFGMGSQNNNNGGPNNMASTGGESGNMENAEEEEEFSKTNESVVPSPLRNERDEYVSPDDAPPSSSEQCIIHEDQTEADLVPYPSTTNNCLEPESASWKSGTDYWLDGDYPPKPSNLNNESEVPFKEVTTVSDSKTGEESVVFQQLSNKKDIIDNCEYSCSDVEMSEENYSEERKSRQGGGHLNENEYDSKDLCYNNVVSASPTSFQYLHQSVSPKENIQIKKKEDSENHDLDDKGDDKLVPDDKSVTEKGHFLKDGVSDTTSSRQNDQHVTAQSYVSSHSSFSSNSTNDQTLCSNTHKNGMVSHSSVPETYTSTVTPSHHHCESYESVANDNHSLLGINGESACTSADTPVSYHTTSPTKSSSLEAHQSDLMIHPKQVTGEDYIPSVSDLSNNFDSSQEDADASYSHLSSPSVSSYKQHLFGETDDIEEVMEDEDKGARRRYPNVYQSYDASVPISHYLPSSQDASHLQGVCLEELSLENNQVIANENSSYVLEEDTYTSTENTASYSSTISDSANENAQICNQEVSSAIPVSDESLPSVVEVEAVDSNDGAMRTGDQSFKTSCSKDSAQETTSQSTNVTAVSSTGINSFPYTRSTRMQGITQPSLMSSTVHIAQHQGGATIMQHQSMTAGFNGRLAQSTVVQNQALANGMQTALLQQRTITNRGQTMVVQQQTMTNVLGGGLAQQTVVQQRVVPGHVAQSAALHAQAMRERALATQQASMMQHQALRVAHAHQARVMGSPLLQTQAIPKPAVIQQAGPSPLIGARLIQTSAPRGSVMQRLVRQRYMGTPVVPARNVQMMTGRPVRVKMTYGIR